MSDGSGFERNPCSGCGSLVDQCPECGSENVRARKRGGSDRDEFADLDFHVFATVGGTDGDTLSYSLECWGCEWSEYRTLTLSVDTDATETNHGESE